MTVDPMEAFWRDPVVHPAAEALPMTSDAELDELAADIKTHGLQEMRSTEGVAGSGSLEP
jgi:hypothetical protein